MKKSFGFYLGVLIFIIAILCAIFFFTNRRNADRRNAEDSEVSDYSLSSNEFDIQESPTGGEELETDEEDERMVNAGIYGETGWYPDQTLSGNLPDENAKRTATNLFTEEYNSFNIFYETEDETEREFFDNVESAVKEIYPACGDVSVITVLPYKDSVYLSVVTDKSGELFFLLDGDAEDFTCKTVPLSDGDVMEIIMDYAEVAGNE